MNIMNNADFGSCDAKETNNSPVSTMSINEFLFALNIDNINLVKLSQYMKESNIIHKASAYSLFYIHII